jgi:hypothetical protein
MYFYGDYCFGTLFGSGQQLTPNVPQLTTFGEDASGEIYLGTETGRLLRLVGPTPPPVPTRVPPSRPDPRARTPRVRPPYA